MPGARLATELTDAQVSQHRVDYSALETIGRQLLIAIGQDPERPGVKDTPRRFAGFWKEFIEYDPGKLDTIFESISAGQLVVVSGLRVYSVCEHHLMPFWADVTIAYITGGKVLGLSKFARIAHKHAHQPQIQERLVEQIANEVIALTGSEDVMVTATGVHTCMIMRGIKTDGKMTSRVINGAFMDDAALVQQVMVLAQA